MAPLSAHVIHERRPAARRGSPAARPPAPRARRRVRPRGHHRQHDRRRHPAHAGAGRRRDPAAPCDPRACGSSAASTRCSDRSASPSSARCCRRPAATTSTRGGRSATRRLRRRLDGLAHLLLPCSATLAIGLASSSATLVPSLAGSVTPLAIACAGAFVALQWAGLRVSSRFQEVTTALKFARVPRARRRGVRARRSRADVRRASTCRPRAAGVARGVIGASRPS